ncbi:hypothetical protein HPB48_005420 [Haemaphysalis longicornis]|uniref:Uncharacterized protein n=1 Tax=Haemaphysalis longicornis TaxID=44386 RepID=A0A9J6GH15_HAELO|nr:hypothetical protein HPB48_005420 [Haemaphysalis longicornis]
MNMRSSVALRTSCQRTPASCSRLLRRGHRLMAHDWCRKLGHSDWDVVRSYLTSLQAFSATHFA